MAARLELIKSQFFDSNGDPLSGGKLYTYVVGTTTNKATYTDAQAGTPNANPIVLNSRGEFSTGVYGLGSYKLVLKDAADNTIWTIDSIAGMNSSAFTSIIDYNNDLTAAVAAIGSTPKTLFIDAAATVSTSTTIPVTLKVVVLKGGSIANTSAITFNGPLEAGPHQVFTSTSSVTINAGGDIWADWFGSAKDRTCLANMMTILGSSTLYHVKLSQQAWTIGSSLTLTENFTMEIPKGASLAITGTLTFSGYVDAGLYQIFSGSGTAVLNRNFVFYPEWYGAIDGTADDVQINAAISSAQSSKGGTVQLSAKTYVLAASIGVDVVAAPMKLLGAGDGAGTLGTKLTVSTGISAITVSGVVNFGIELGDFNITGNATASQNGILFLGDSGDYPTRVNVHDISIYNVGGYGIAIDSGEDLDFRNVLVDGAGVTGIVLDAGVGGGSGTTLQNVSFSNCRVQDCVSVGLHIDKGSKLSFDNCAFNSTVTPSSFAGTGIKISGACDRLYFRNTEIKNNKYQGVYLLSNAQNIYDVSFVNTQLVLLGNDSGEAGFEVQKTGSGNVTFLRIDGMEVSRTGGTTHAYSLRLLSLIEKSEIVNIKDTTTGDLTKVTFPSDSYTVIKGVDVLADIALDNTGTPSVKGGSSFVTGGTTTITDFLGGYRGQIINVRVAHTLTFTDSASLQMADNLSLAAVAGDHLTFIYLGTSSGWQEVGRTRNALGKVANLANSTTVSALGASIGLRADATNISAINDGVQGQIFTISAGASFSIVQGSTIKLNGSANRLMVAGDTTTLVYTGAVWYEIGRMTA